MAQIWSFVKQLKIEPFCFLFMVAIYLKYQIGTQFIQDKICINDLRQTAEVCYDVMSRSDGQYSALKDAILIKSTNYGLYNGLITLIPSVMFTLFFGPWSDKFISGRKILLVSAAIGSTLSCLVDLLNAIFFDWPTEYILLAVIPSSVTGGMFAMMTAMFSYVTKTAAPGTLIMRFAIIETIMGMATPISALLPNYILPMTPWFFPDRIRNYVGVFSISFLLSVPSVLWLYFVINEKEDARDDDDSLISEEENNVEPVASERKPEVDVPWTTAIKSIFVLDNLKILVAVVKRKRQNGRHKILWVMLANQALGFMAFMGSMLIQFQYSEKMFNWSYERYNQVSAIFSIVHLVIGAPVLIPIFSKGLKMTEPEMGITGCLFWIFSLLVMGLYQHEGAVYISQCLSTMSAVIGVTTRTFVTRLIESDEVGSVYSITAGFQATMPLAASVMFTQIFNATLDTAPGLVYLISGYLVLFVMITFVIADLHSRFESRSKPDLSIQ